MTPTLNKELKATKEAIITAVRNAVMNSGKPAETVKLLTETQDIDTVKWILAETVKANEWDGRYSRQVKDWANHVYIPGLFSDEGKGYGLLTASPHPAHINQLVEAIIKY